MLETEEIQPSEASLHKIEDAHACQSHIWNNTFWQFLRYCLVGGANTALDLLTFNALLWIFPTNNVLALVGYNSIAYTSGAASSFFLNKYWTFRHKQGMTRREIIRFVIILFVEVLYSNGLMWLIGKALQPFIANATLWADASKVLTVGIGAVISYLCMRFWIFASGLQYEHKKEEVHNRLPTR